MTAPAPAPLRVESSDLVVLREYHRVDSFFVRQTVESENIMCGDVRTLKTFASIRAALLLVPLNDVKATLKAKLNIEQRPYRILGACIPPPAHRAIEDDPDIRLPLPCNVVVREAADGTITVAFMDREAVLQLVDKPEVPVLGKEVKALLQRVCTSLKV